MDSERLELLRTIARQQEKILRLRRMLFEMTSLTDWIAAGYSDAEYLALVEQFETAPAALDDTVEG